MTDNVVRPPDGVFLFHFILFFRRRLLPAPLPSVALWIIQDYVVIPLIPIALRFQSKYGDAKVAAGGS